MKTDLIPIDFCNETIKLKKGIESGFIALGERLDRIKNEKLWQGEWDSWYEFLLEMNLSEATASKLINVYNTFVVSFKIPAEKLAKAGWSGLYEIIPICDSRQKAVEMVEKVSLLKRDDMREELRVAKIGEHEHDWHDLHLRKCSVCQRAEKIN